MGVADIIEALPSAASGNNPDGDKLRKELIDGIPGIIPDDAAVIGGTLQINPLDSELGALRSVYVYFGALFSYDPLDATTAHDGITCLVLIGGYRYKLAGDMRVPALKSASVTVPPDPADPLPENRPVYGDAYLNLGGNWPHAVNSIEVWTSRGGGSWVEVKPDYGPPLWVRDGRYYIHWEGDGWVDGVGNRSLGPGTVPFTALSWDGRVENQTTTGPPASWNKGVAYIAAPAASAPWRAGWLYIADSAGVLANGDSFTEIVPWIGLTTFDKTLLIDVRWNGAAWVPSSGSIVGYAFQKTDGTNSTTDRGSGNYVYSTTVAPTTSNRRLTDDVAIANYAAKRTDAPLKFSYRAYVLPGNGAAAGDKAVAAIFRDSEVSALDWVPFTLISSTPDMVAANVDIDFYITAKDNSAHTYTVALMISTGVGLISFLQRRLFSLDEYA